MKEICAEHGVEIISKIFSAGYGGAVLAHNSNLAAGLPVKDALYVVKGGQATLAPDPPVEIVNGGFEEFTGGRATGFVRPEKWEEIIFQDSEVVKQVAR